MIVIAIDPGKVCGWAVWNDGQRGENYGLKQSGQAEAFEVQEWLESTIPLHQPFGLHVVVERFVIDETTPGADAHWAMYPLGAISYWCAKHEVPLTFQSAGDVKDFATDDKLRNLGWHHSTVGGHENDALRHLVVFLVKHRRLDLSVLAGPSNNSQK